MKRRLLAAAILSLAALTAFAQTPSVVNGTLQPRAAQLTAEREVAAIMKSVPGPAWAGYEVPVAGRNGNVGCWSNDRQQAVRQTGPLKLEGATSIYVLFRFADARIQEVRVASPECVLDAGGLTLSWLTGITPASSLDWLATLASSDASRHVANDATMAIALHAAPQATDRLIAIARGNHTADVRGAAVFWLAQRAGDKAAGAISDALDDPDTEVKKKAVFALSRLPKNEGVPKLMEVARTNKNPEVRRQAMFWLGQSRDPRAIEFFEQILK
jgi:hypothetical protein